jgi:hypothetical protein
MSTPCVYLLHFSQPIAPGHPCQHYIGFANDPWMRLEEHRAGRGARLCQVALERNIGFDLVRLWPGDGCISSWGQKVTVTGAVVVHRLVASSPVTVT